VDEWQAGELIERVAAIGVSQDKVTAWTEGCEQAGECGRSARAVGQVTQAVVCHSEVEASREAGQALKRGGRELGSQIVLLGDRPPDRETRSVDVDPVHHRAQPGEIRTESAEAAPRIEQTRVDEIPPGGCAVYLDERVTAARHETGIRSQRGWTRSAQSTCVRTVEGRHLSGEGLSDDIETTVRVGR
jgi:hypothetical protein